MRSSLGSFSSGSLRSVGKGTTEALAMGGILVCCTAQYLGTLSRSATLLCCTAAFFCKAPMRRRAECLRALTGLRHVHQRPGGCCKAATACAQLDASDL